MTSFTLIGIVLATALIAYFFGRQISIVRSQGSFKELHSLPSYHGLYVFLWVAVPALLVLAAWNVGQNFYIFNVATAYFPPEVASGGDAALRMTTVLDIAAGFERLDQQSQQRIVYGLTELRGAMRELGVALPPEVPQYVLNAARDVVDTRDALTFNKTVVVLGLAALGFVGSIMTISKGLRARNLVEAFVRVVLFLGSAIAILTTIGIVLSMLFETMRFFGFDPFRPGFEPLVRGIDPSEFFFGTVWEPGFEFGGGESTGVKNHFGLIPLLWGTAYISLIALLIAVPIGLYSAIYMSEFASKRVRAFGKPMLEVLAGIPTIVYGFFALVTVGPFIRDTVMLVSGVSVSAASVATAGVVMGMMLIPFISSLSDDIINAVPQSLRDGSLGLGATKAETVRKVILPAALPGIVGAVLLAASRAIGETMIVVLAAGGAAQITGNPFDPVTTVTVAIVQQLTGDAAFTSPQALVAFALGITLFFVTLVMNVAALRIVRKYREQYE